MDKQLDYVVVLNYSLPETEPCYLKIRVTPADSPDAPLDITFSGTWAKRMHFLEPGFRLTLTVTRTTQIGLHVEGESSYFQVISCRIDLRPNDFITVDSNCNVVEEQPPHAGWFGRPGQPSLVIPLTSLHKGNATATVCGVFFSSLAPGARKYLDNYRGEYYSSNLLLADLSFRKIPAASIRQCINGYPQFSLQQWSTVSTASLPWVKVGQVVKATNIVPKNKCDNRWNLYYKQRLSGGSKIEVFDNDKVPTELKAVAEWGREIIATQSLLGDGYKGWLSQVNHTGIDVIVRVAEAVQPGECCFIVDDMQTQMQIKMKADEAATYVLGKIKKGDWLLLRNVRKSENTVFVPPHFCIPLPEWSYDVRQALTVLDAPPKPIDAALTTTTVASSSSSEDEDEPTIRFIEESQVYHAGATQVAPEPKKRKLGF